MIVTSKLRKTAGMFCAGSFKQWQKLTGFAFPDKYLQAWKRAVSFRRVVQFDVAEEFSRLYQEKLFLKEILNAFVMGIFAWIAQSTVAMH